MGALYAFMIPYQSYENTDKHHESCNNQDNSSRYVRILTDILHPLEHHSSSENWNSSGFPPEAIAVTVPLQTLSTSHLTQRERRLM
jgi:hypothetical protein